MSEVKTSDATGNISSNVLPRAAHSEKIELDSEMQHWLPQKGEWCDSLADMLRTSENRFYMFHSFMNQ